uniref:Uncharacterized protein n=1 Tax=Oryzias melastigma TaxID=30732 RepID=A0A3B3BI05_ORYME
MRPSSNSTFSTISRRPSNHQDRGRGRQNWRGPPRGRGHRNFKSSSHHQETDCRRGREHPAKQC